MLKLPSNITWGMMRGYVNKNYNENASTPKPDTEQAEATTSRPKHEERRRRMSLRKRRKPSTRGKLVARSIGRAKPMRRKVTDIFRKKIKKLKKLRATKRFGKGTSKKETKLLPEAVAPESSVDPPTPVNPTKVVSSDKCSPAKPYFLRNHQKDTDHPPDVPGSQQGKGEQKRKKRNASAGLSLKGIALQIFDNTRASSAWTPGKTPKKKGPGRPEASTPAPAILSASNEWPTLSESRRVKSGAKDTAEEIVKNKQLGKVMRLSRRTGADATSSKRSEQDLVKTSATGATLPSTIASNRTWARVAAGSYKPSQGEPSSTPTRKIESTSNEPNRGTLQDISITQGQSKQTEAESCLTYTNRIWGDGVKGKGKHQSMKFYRKHFGEGRSSKRRRHRLKGVKGPKSTKAFPKLQTMKAAASILKTLDVKAEGPSTEGKVFQDEKATTQNFNGEHKWCIDNMCVVYTKPATSVISLREPRGPNGKGKKKGVNRCNNRSVTPKSWGSLFNSKIRGMCEANKTGIDDSQSDNELSTLLSNVSFGTTNSSQDQTTLVVDTQTEPTKENSHQKLPPHIKFLQQKKQNSERKSGKSGEEAATQVKKISHRYRALVRKDGNRLDAKAITEKQTRSRRSDVIQESKMMTRSQKEHTRRKSRDRHVCVQRTSSHSFKSRSASPAPDAVTWQHWVGTSKDYLALTKGRSKTPTTTVCKKGKPSEENQGANNSLDQTYGSSLASDPSSALGRPMTAKSAPVLSHQSVSYFDLELVGENSFDCNWWSTYLSSSDAMACELVPLPDDVTMCRRPYTRSRVCVSCSDFSKVF